MLAGTDSAALPQLPGQLEPLFGRKPLSSNVMEADEEIIRPLPGYQGSVAWLSGHTREWPVPMP